jgi:hypothetical protein
MGGWEEEDVNPMESILSALLDEDRAQDERAK